MIYYLMPLTMALVALVADELHERRAQAARMSALLGRLTDQLTPPILALFTFLSGVVLPRRAPRPRPQDDWRCSNGFSRWASSRPRTFCRACLARRCCCSRRGWPVASTPLTC